MCGWLCVCVCGNVCVCECVCDSVYDAAGTRCKLSPRHVEKGEAYGKKVGITVKLEKKYKAAGRQTKRWRCKHRESGRFSRRLFWSLHNSICWSLHAWVCNAATLRNAKNPSSKNCHNHFKLFISWPHLPLDSSFSSSRSPLSLSFFSELTGSQQRGQRSNYLSLYKEGNTAGQQPRREMREC